METRISAGESVTLDTELNHFINDKLSCVSPREFDPDVGLVESGIARQMVAAGPATDGDGTRRYRDDGILILLHAVAIPVARAAPVVVELHHCVPVSTCLSQIVRKKHTYPLGISCPE